MLLTKRQIKAFQIEILSWYGKNKRNLPWRRTREPYPILVSEIMAQQTQVSRVVSKYETWLHAFPTIEDLAVARKEDILTLWSGLGYNRRALYLQKAAQVIINEYNGYWPQAIVELEKLPGIGSYTSRAIACFAFNQQVAVVDANVRKVILIKFSQYVSAGLLGKKELQDFADVLLPIGKAYEWNQALMDYSALVLQKEKVPTKKQPKFINSNRYYRGKLLKLLLRSKQMPIQQIGLLLRDDFSTSHTSWRDKLLSDLEIDGLIKIESGKVCI